jgi:hypothetical protein
MGSTDAISILKQLNKGVQEKVQAVRNLGFNSEKVTVRLQEILNEEGMRFISELRTADRKKRKLGINPFVDWNMEFSTQGSMMKVDIYANEKSGVPEEYMDNDLYQFWRKSEDNLPYANDELMAHEELDFMGVEDDIVNFDNTQTTESVSSKTKIRKPTEKCCEKTKKDRYERGIVAIQNEFGILDRIEALKLMNEICERAKINGEIIEVNEKKKSLTKDKSPVFFEKLEEFNDDKFVTPLRKTIYNKISKSRVDHILNLYDHVRSITSESSVSDAQCVANVVAYLKREGHDYLNSRKLMSLLVKRTKQHIEKKTRRNVNKKFEADVWSHLVQSEYAFVLKQEYVIQQLRPTFTVPLVKIEHLATLLPKYALQPSFAVTVKAILYQLSLF